jgi:hypothetical protein
MKRTRNRATHTWNGWPVRVVSEWKDQRQIYILAGPRFSQMAWVSALSLIPVVERSDERTPDQR